MERIAGALVHLPENPRRSITFDRGTEIVEISMVCALFNMINKLNDSFCGDLKTLECNQKQWNAGEGPLVAEIETYARRFTGVGATERDPQAGQTRSAGT